MVKPFGSSQFLALFSLSDLDHSSWISSDSLVELPQFLAPTFLHFTKAPDA